MTESEDGGRSEALAIAAFDIVERHLDEVRENLFREDVTIDRLRDLFNSFALEHGDIEPILKKNGARLWRDRCLAERKKREHLEQEIKYLREVELRLRARMEDLQKIARR